MFENRSSKIKVGFGSVVEIYSSKSIRIVMGHWIFFWNTFAFFVYEPPSHHTYKSPKKFLWISYMETSELKGSKKTYCPRITACLIRFWERKVKWVRRKISQAEKSQLKRTNRNNIIATNFIWEQQKGLAALQLSFSEFKVLSSTPNFRLICIFDTS